MYFETFLGMRYLKAKRKQAFISIITLISVVGVMMGVMALIVVLSVMSGARAYMTSKILGVDAHLIISKYGGEFNNYEDILKDVKAVDGVVAVTPSIYDYVLLNTSSGISSPAALRGLDTESVGGVINIEPMIKDGTLASLDNNYDGLPAIIIGKDLAKQIGVIPGDVLTVTSPQGKLTPLGRTANNREYMVTGLFNSGYYEYDLSMVLVSLKEAQNLLGIENCVTKIEVRVNEAYQSHHIGESIENLLGYPYWVQDWKERNKTLIAALKMEKIGMFIILTLIVLVGALNIVSSLVMVVMEKTRDVAILRAMGATKRSIMAIFMFQGMIVGIVGTLAGLISGLGICYLLDKYEFIQLPSEVYIFSSLPVRVETLDVVLVTITAFLLSFLATIYPSWHASRLNPVEALRYE